MTAAKSVHLFCSGAVLALGVVTLTAAADVVINSEWKSRDLTIDGRIDDWAAPTAIENAPAVAAANDNEFLYLVISSADPRIRAGLARGLVVWFDPARKKKTDFGLQFARTMSAGADGEARAYEPAGLDEIDALGPGKIRRLVELTPAFAVTAASGTTSGTVVFELKLPLASSAARPYAAGTPAGESIQLGIFTPDPTQLSRAREPEGPIDPQRIGLGPLIGGPPSRIPLPDGSHPPKVEKPLTLKQWVVVQLARVPQP